VLTANVGNSNWGCREYHFNLCYSDVRQRINLEIARLQPDIIALQELTDQAQCEEFTEKTPQKECYRFWKKEPPDQARRLVGSDYTIVCDSRNRYECIAVSTSSGVIEGCGVGELCDQKIATDVPQAGCDTGFTASSVNAILHGQVITIVNAHLQSTSISCREWSLRQIFESVEGRLPLASGERVLLLGDFNLDPFRSSDASTYLWCNYVGMPGDGKPFWYHSGPVKRQPPYRTFSGPLIGPSTVDFSVSNFAYGTSVTLGETETTNRLDGGSGMDHRALFGELCFPSK